MFHLCFDFGGMKYFVCALIILVTSLACDRKEVSSEFQYQVDVNYIYEKHYNRDWDTSKIAEELVGKWQWLACYTSGFGGERMNCFSKEVNLELEFLKNNKMIIYKNGKMDAETWWRIEPFSDTEYKLTMPSPIRQVNGVILFYDDMVTFRYSIVDGNDNYFARISN